MNTLLNQTNQSMYTKENLAQLKKMDSHAPQVMKAFWAFDKAAVADGAIPVKYKELIAVAKNAAEKVKQHGEAVRLEPMSAFERKCVHDVINAMAGVASESEGVEPSRRIVVRAV